MIWSSGWLAKAGLREPAFCFSFLRKLRPVAGQSIRPYAGSVRNSGNSRLRDISVNSLAALV